ncbi:MAG: 4-hydroxy-tetrahydrodipicolinate reductase [Chitinophagaceae bacterium]|jgi:4-hydroxy-tetrahydrodipicolinate reductase
MNIALIGYGKMGKTIETIALKRGHQIVLKISSQNPRDLNDEELKKADVCIEFSTPETAFHHVQSCLNAGIPTVCGTTAWLDKLQEAEEICRQQDTSFIFASNFSIGVNLFFRINEMVAQLMAPHHAYRVSMEEIHHTQKKDAPSGTAVTLANTILENQADMHKWVNHPSDKKDELAIISKRIDPAPGTHFITYQSEIDEIQLSHTAHSREGFAYGAVLAAEFIAGKKGIFQMKDVLGI